MGKALFFDLDGTLTDPAPGITGCIQYAHERLGLAPPPQSELIWCIGPPLLESFRQLVGEAKAEAALEHYRERFGEVGLFENAVYPGIEPALRELKEGGARLYVASSKPLVYVRRILVHFGLNASFDEVFGSELDGRRSDKADLLAHALEQTGVEACDATMIGDRSHDAIGARRNDMAFLGVLYGYGSETEFRSIGVDRWVSHPEELVQTL